MEQATTRNYEKFFTPERVAKFMVELVDPKPGQAILEPSAGNGAIVKAIHSHEPKTIIFAIEVNEKYRADLKLAGAKIVVIRDWMEVPEYAKWNSCIANPPFGNGIDLQAHFDKICRVVKTGGKVVMIVPADFDPKREHKTYTLENWSKNSDGTTTGIKIIEFIS